MIVKQPIKGSHTPWGTADFARSLIPGVVSISTSSHGGYWLSPLRWIQLKAKFPTFVPYAGPQWLEEDCDAAMLALAFPAEVLASKLEQRPECGLTEPALIYMACSYASQPECIPEELKQIASTFRNAHGDLFRLSACGSLPKRFEHYAVTHATTNFQRPMWALFTSLKKRRSLECVITDDCNASLPIFPSQDEIVTASIQVELAKALPEPEPITV